MAVRMRTTGAATFTASDDWQDRPRYEVAWIGTNPIGVHDRGAADLPELLENGDSYTIPVGTDYDWTLTPAGKPNMDADAGMAAVINAGADEVTLRFSLHSGDPGDAGTANELTPARNPGYARAAAAFRASST